MNFNRFEKSKKLDNFLKSNAPIAPRPPLDHEKIILESFKNYTNKRASMVRNIFVGISGIAALIPLFLWFSVSQNKVSVNDPVGTILLEVIDEYGQNSKNSPDFYDEWDLLAETVTLNAKSD